MVDLPSPASSGSIARRGSDFCATTRLTLPNTTALQVGVCDTSLQCVPPHGGVLAFTRESPALHCGQHYSTCTTTSVAACAAGAMTVMPQNLCARR